MVRIARNLVDEMVEHAREDLPNECCGILAGPGEEVVKRFPMTNVSASPFRFDMDPIEIMNVDTEAADNGWGLVAVYHSHTRSEAYPSDTDIRLLGGFGEWYTDTRFVLVSLMDNENPAVRIFRIERGEVTEEALDVV